MERHEPWAEDYFAWADHAFDLREVFTKPEALKGIRVVELATLILAPATASILGEMGAEVIKVELPGVGDTMRYITPQSFYWRNASLNFLSDTRNKYHVTLDVRQPEGRELFLQLVDRADVLIENLRAGTMEEKWAIGYQTLSTRHPRLIYLAGTGFGQWGPFALGRASYDALAQAASGLSMISGFPGRPPLKIATFIGDWFGALMCAVGVLVALHHRERTGCGQFVDYAQSEGLIRSMDWTWIYECVTGLQRGRWGNRDVAICPSGIFRCRDRYVALSVGRDEEFRGLCAAMGRPDLAGDLRFATLGARQMEEHAKGLESLLSDWCAQHLATEVEVLGETYGFAVAPVASAPDHYHDPHLRARGTVIEVDDPISGTVVDYGTLPKLSGTPGRVRWFARPVGFDNGYVFRKLLNLSSAEIRRLESMGIISGWPDRPGAGPPQEWKGEGTILGTEGQGLDEARTQGAAVQGRVSNLQNVPNEASSLKRAASLERATFRREDGWPDWTRDRTSPDRAAGKAEALDGLVVLDASSAHFGGLFCSSILAEFGAEVIRVEPPGGDPARQFTPFGIMHKGTGLPYLVEGRNKYHVTLKLVSADGRKIWLELARRADVIIESFAPGELDRYGIGYRQLSEVNPSLLYLALSTHGQFGPRARTRRPDYDIIGQALSGLVQVCGERKEDEEGPHAVPTRAGHWLSWYAQGGWAAFGILAALRHRVVTGQGQMVDMAGAEALMRFVDFNLLLYHANGRVRGRVGPFDESNNPYTYVACKDGYVFLAGFSDPNFCALTEIMGRSDLREDPRFDSAVKRSQPEHWWPLYREIEKWTVGLTASEILERTMAYRGKGVVVTGKVNTPGETLREKHWWERGVFQMFEDGAYGELLVQAPPWKMTETPPRLKWLCRPVGADNPYVYLKYLGYGPGRIHDLQERGIL